MLASGLNGQTKVVGPELDKDTIVRAYARWAPVYDLVFGAVFEHGRRAAIDAAERIGGRILEVGVGTGISLPDYTAATACSASTSRSRCCARPRSASPRSDCTTSRACR